jgi:hypothetical protein
MKNTQKTHRTMIMDFVESKGFATRTEILQFICKTFWGIEYDYRYHRGTYGCAFTPLSTGTLLAPSPTEPRYLVNFDHKYIIANATR